MISDNDDITVKRWALQKMRDILEIKIPGIYGHATAHIDDALTEGERENAKLAAEVEAVAVGHVNAKMLEWLQQGKYREIPLFGWNAEDVDDVPLFAREPAVDAIGICDKEIAYLNIFHDSPARLESIKAVERVRVAIRAALPESGK